MTTIRVPIVRWVDNSNPGWVECHLTDASGRTWRLIDKLPVFSEDMSLDENSDYPQPSVLACEIIETRINSEGRKILVVDTGQPWGLQSVEGVTRFDVFQEQIELCELPES